MIFENDMFHTDLGLSKRKGSNVDRVLMIDVFTKLQFEVRVYTNLTTTEILQKLEAARFEDHSHADMFAVVILSHGNEGCQYNKSNHLICIGPFNVNRAKDNCTTLLKHLTFLIKMLFTQVYCMDMIAPMLYKRSGNPSLQPTVKTWQGNLNFSLSRYQN